MKTLIVCATMVFNTSGFPWNAEDQKSLNFNKFRCVEIWEDAPCLKMFVKRGATHYWAICGEGTSENTTVR